MIKAFIDIHGILCAEAEGEDAFVSRVEREFRDHLVTGEPSREPELSIHFGPFEAPSASNLAVERNMVFAREGYRGARWQVKIEGFEEERFRMYFHGNPLSRMIAVKRVMEPSLRFLMDQKGFPMVHSACLVKDGRGVLVAARGGGGKTTLVLRWLEDGNPFLSDDYSILAPGKVLSYVTPLRIGLRNLMESSSLRKIPLRHQAEIVFRTASRYLFLKKVRLAFKAPAKKFFPFSNLVPEARLCAVALIRSMARDFSLREVSPEEMAGALADIDREEAYRFAGYLDAYEKNFPASQASGFFKAHQDRIYSIIKPLPCYELDMPRKWTNSTWNKLKETFFAR
jgi:hypothetical protein